MPSLLTAESPTLKSVGSAALDVVEDVFLIKGYYIIYGIKECSSDKFL